MHVEAYEGFKWALDRSRLDYRAPLRVLDVGGQNVNGTVHDLFTDIGTKVYTLDLENADIIADATTWRSDQKFDVVIATEVFEHVHRWDLVIQTMREALDPDGPGVLIATCASDGRPPHGSTGAPAPAVDEHYGNVTPFDLEFWLKTFFPGGMTEVRYNYPPGDAYMWASVKPLLDITVIIPTVPKREGFLEQAKDSVFRQTLPATQLLVVPDHHREGPAVVRNRGIAEATTEWVAFLDDDDWLLPQHLDILARAQIDSGADLVWPWFEVAGGTDPFPMHRGRQWDPDDPHQIPINVLVRKSALDEVGGFHTIGADAGTDSEGHRAGEDFELWLRLSAAGYKFHHVPDQTWMWRHWNGNSSGLPSRVRW